MNRLEKCKLAVERGFRYDPETGIIYGVKGKIITAKHKNGYILMSIGLNASNLLGHHFAWYIVNREIVTMIDHIDGNTSNNKIDNLRVVTHQENQCNRKKAKGYSYNKLTNKWLARITLNGKPFHLGCFDTENEARKNYIIAKEKYHTIGELENGLKTMKLDKIIKNETKILEKNLKRENYLNGIHKTKGYYFSKQKNKWVVQFRHKKKRYYFGLYETEDEANKIYNEAKNKLNKQ